MIDCNAIQVHDNQICISFLDKQFTEFKGISEKRKKAAQKRWKKGSENQDINASALQDECKSNAIREDKIREEKRREEKRRKKKKILF